jgi:hypothetical protein
MRIHLDIVLVLAGVAPLLAQQTPVNRTVFVVVTDQMKRAVTGLPRESFGVTEDGALRPVTAFSDANSPISLAFVAQSIPGEVAELKRPGDEMFQAQSVADALRALAGSKNSRKALIFTAGTIVGEIPSGVQLLKTGSQNLRKSVIEVMNSYSFRFSSSVPASAVEVNLRPPAGLPPLTVTTW